MSTTIAINGFGRIGRPALKIALTKKELKVVAINDLTDVPTIAHLLKYDSSYGIYNHEIKVLDHALAIDGQEIKVFAEKDPGRLPWKAMNIDVVLECTGQFASDETARTHLVAGARKVIISAPAEGETPVPTFVLGVNEEKYHPETDDVVSMASCTTNCLAPMVSVLHQEMTIMKGLMTTVHSYTNDQRVLDLPHKDLRRARAAALNIIPTSTGAAKATTLVVPELAGKLDALSIRVPTPTVSLCDLVAEVGRETSKEEIDRMYIEASKHERLEGILGVSLEPLVSTDYRGNPYSAIIDLPLTRVIGNLVKVIAWYDNEWGYANRLVEFAQYLGKKL